MNKDLCELKKIDEKINAKFRFIKNNPENNLNNINEIKELKNIIYEKISNIFIYNLKKLINIESTQKNLAKKIGISEDLLSKYKSGEAFPSIDTLLYISLVYNISIDKFIGIPLSTSEIEILADTDELDANIFEEKYYVYFFATNIGREGSIHEGLVEIKDNLAIFKILSHDEVIKYFRGIYAFEDKLISFNLQNSSEGTVFINMIKPNVNKNKYFGGLALLMLPSDANSKPCAQKILFSKVRLDRDLYYKELKELLNFKTENTTFEHVKISQRDDELAYNFIRKSQG